MKTDLITQMYDGPSWSSIIKKLKSNNMNNQEIQQELQELETRMAELRGKLEKPDIPKYNGGKFYGYKRKGYNDKFVLLRPDYVADKVAAYRLSCDGICVTLDAWSFSATLSFTEFCEKASELGDSIHVFNTRKELLLWLAE